MMMRTILFAIIAAAVFWAGQKIYFKPSYIYGQDLPEFNLELINGKSLRTADLKGKYVLIDFWGSWCGPCRKESPDLVKLYDEFGGDKGGVDFEILSIGIETREIRWKKAIEKDNLYWPWHYSSMRRFRGPLAKEFGIREIPTKFLVDPKGMIVGVNLSFDEIKEVLKSNDGLTE